jgi:hypothetical protein
MTVGLIDDVEYTILMMQDIAEARIIGSERMILDLARHGVAILEIPCRECDRACWVTADGYSRAQPHPYPVCIACFGRAIARFDNMGYDAIEAARQISDLYKAELERHRTGH